MRERGGGARERAACSRGRGFQLTCDPEGPSAAGGQPRHSRGGAAEALPAGHSSGGRALGPENRAARARATYYRIGMVRTAQC